MADDQTKETPTNADKMSAMTLANQDSYTSNIERDIVKGWNDRRLANNVELTSLVPFVQLIGLFDATEYEKMFGHDEGALSSKPVYFTPDSDAGIVANTKVSDYIKEHHIGKEETDIPKENLWDWIQKKLKSRFIDMFIYEGEVSGEGEDQQSILTMTPMDGIMMAEYKSQASGATYNEEGEFQGIDSTGGIGITDLQVDYGKSNALGSRKLNMRLTVNEPAILDEYPEYAKLSTMQGEFIIIYGWSNPQIIEGFDATPPPVLLPSTSNSGNEKMMIVGLDNMDTGGYWSAVKLNVTSYDFSFNEMGQLEINVGFMDKTSMMMNSTRIASIASTWRRIMGTGDYDPATTSNDPSADFTEVMVTLADGSKIPVADLIANEQNSSSETGSTPTGEAPATIEDLHQRRAVPFLDSLNAVAEASDIPYNADKGDLNQTTYWNEVRKREKQGFPYGGPGIRSYEKITVRRPVAPRSDADEPDNSDADPGMADTVATEEVTAYRVKVVYYYLGWVLEAMRLSLNSQNRSRVKGGDTSFNPKFKYLKNESSSQLKSAFQQKVTQTDRANTSTERLQNAIIRLKQNCMFPFKAREVSVSWRYDETTGRRVAYWPAWGQTTNAARPQDVISLPCAGNVVVEEDRTMKLQDLRKIRDGKNTRGALGKSNREKIANKIFPNPFEDSELAGIMPMRGHRIRIKPNDPAYEKILDDDERRASSFYVFKPDWFQENVIKTESQDTPDPERLISLDDGQVRTDEGDTLRTISVVPAGGSPEGFNPLDPISYKAKDRGGRFFYRVIRATDFDLSTRNINARTFVMEVDAFRQSDGEIWDLTQRKWHGLYVTYLGNYFSHIMKVRLAELEKEGKTVEDIYNEPVDLDWLTSRVFNNWRASGSGSRGGDRWVPATWEQVKRHFPADEDLKDSIKKATDAERTLTADLADEEVAFADVETKITEKQNINNNIKEEIEELTGGRYNIGEDAAHNRILGNLKNWKEIVVGKFDLVRDTYEKISEYEANYSQPQVKLEWMIWKKYGIPTDNWYSSPSLGDGENMQSNWKNKNPDQLKELQIEVETQQAIVDKKIVQITKNDNDLRDENNRYLDIEQNIEAMQAEKNDAVRRLTRYQSYLTEDAKGERELSPYDDTSDFDDVLEIDMGRDQPMRLTTKVAQQWYQRFTTDPGLKNGQGYNWMKGVMDISNYGPQPGGTPFFRPSKYRGFQFDLALRHADIKGQPRIVLDLEKVRDKHGTITPFAYPFGNKAKIYLTKSAHTYNLSWRYFGIGGVPNENGRNDYGFYSGDREIDEQTGENIGGDHFADYSEFLDLFGLAPPQEFSAGALNLPSWMSGGQGNMALPTIMTSPWPPLWPLPGMTPHEMPSHQEALYRLNSIRHLPQPVKTKDDPFYYMVDDANNVIMPGPEGSPNEGWFVQTGWYLGYGGAPVYLYPSKDNAVQIDRNTGKIIKYGNSDYFRGVNGGQNRMGDWKESKDWRSYGTHYRIGNNQHNLNLTLDEKRALVFQRGPRTWGVGMNYHNDRHDYIGHRGSTKKEVWLMGPEVPSWGASAPGNTMGPQEFDWNKMGKTRIVGGGKIVREGAWDLGYYNLVTADGSPAGTSKKGDYSGIPDGPYKGPTKWRKSGYTNPDWPYGTGWYKENKQYGSHASPTTSPTKNVLLIGDLLEQLPNKGFFTTVNNDNYSPSTIAADGKIINGKELNIGFVDFIIQNVYAPIGKSRRIATRGGGNATGMRGSVHLVKDKGRDGVDDKWMTNDTTYGHLFVPQDSDEEVDAPSKDISFTDFDLKNVESVADIPIRRDIVDNLMNKNNANMSLAQFIQEIIHPGAIGINTGNIHVSIRQKAAGNFQVFQATKNWQAKAAEVDMEYREKLFSHKYPVNHFLIDYKAQDSLIENIDMSSKFDPAMTLTYERGAAAFAGNPSAIVKFLAYGTVAQDLKDFLDDEDKVNNTNLYANVFSDIGKAATGEYAKIVIAQNAFFDVPKNNQNKIVSNTVIAKFLMQKPERMNKLNALIQSQPGSNFATQLLSHYMRKCTLTIHGTTNLTPFNSINVTGVLPNLEGLYLITSLRESVTTSNFQTIIEAVLLRPKTIEDLDHKYTP